VPPGAAQRRTRRGNGINPIAAAGAADLAFDTRAQRLAAMLEQVAGIPAFKSRALRLAT
jgi:hypothetical protein